MSSHPMPDSAVFDLSSTFVHLDPDVGVRPPPGSTRASGYLERDGSETDLGGAGERELWRTADAAEPGVALLVNPRPGTPHRPRAGR